MINGSPKLGKSNSGVMLEILKTLMNTEHEISHYNINKAPLTNEQYSELCQMDTLVFAFPLYIDAIPSHLLRMLAELQKHLKLERKSEVYVYVIVNNGFFEGQQNHIALEIMNNWCIRSGLHFGQGIGQGAGEMMGFIENVPVGHGPLKKLGSAMQRLADNIHSRGIDEPMLFSPDIPRFVWKFSGTRFFWNANAKKNGLKKKDIMKRL